MNLGWIRTTRDVSLCLFRPWILEKDMLEIENFDYSD